MAQSQEVKDHRHNLRKEHVGKPRVVHTGEVEVEVRVACADPDCAGYWTGSAELELDVEDVEGFGEMFNHD